MTEKIELTTLNRPVPRFVFDQLKRLDENGEYYAVSWLDGNYGTSFFNWLYENSRFKTVSGNPAVRELMSLITLGYTLEEEKEEKYYLIVNNLYVNFDTKDNEITFEDETEFEQWKTKFTLKEIKDTPLLRPFARFKKLVNK